MFLNGKQPFRLLPSRLLGWWLAGVNLNFDLYLLHFINDSIKTQFRFRRKVKRGNVYIYIFKLRTLKPHFYFNPCREIQVTIFKFLNLALNIADMGIILQIHYYIG
jgi:hypothetical protein